jgi:hypothetical protein
MKILTALKKIKHLDRKIEKNLKRISKYCSVIVEDDEAPPAYDEDDIRKMSQQVKDWAVHKAAIRAALHLTNARTRVPFHGRELSIDELLLYQNVVIPAEMACLTNLRRKEKGGLGYMSREVSKNAMVITQYDPKERDAAIEKLEDIKEELDALLDRMNIETDVIGLAD